MEVWRVLVLQLLQERFLLRHLGASQPQDDVQLGCPIIGANEFRRAVCNLAWRSRAAKRCIGQIDWSGRMIGRGSDLGTCRPRGEQGSREDHEDGQSPKSGRGLG